MAKKELSINEFFNLVEKKAKELEQQEVFHGNNKGLAYALLAVMEVGEENTLK